MVQHLKSTGIKDEQILEMNFESFAFKNMTSDKLYDYVKQHIAEDKRMYLFFDEVQRVPDWEEAINSFRVDFNCYIYAKENPWVAARGFLIFSHMFFNLFIAVL